MCYSINWLKNTAKYQNFLSITELEVPTIAAINGAAVGAGLCVADLLGSPRTQNLSQHLRCGPHVRLPQEKLYVT